VTLIRLRRRLVAALFLMSAQHAIAQTPCEAGADTPSAACRTSRIDSAKARRWQVDLIPFMWAVGIKGTTELENRSLPVDVTFQDILDHLRGFVFAAFEVRYGHWSVAADGNYLKLEDRLLEIPLAAFPPSPSGAQADFVAKQAMVEAEARYQLHAAPLEVDLLAGGRGWVIDNALSLSSAAHPATNLALNERWVDPLVGARASIVPSPRLLLEVLGDVGGFGAAARLDWRVVGAVGYQINSRWTARLLYRRVAVDFKDSRKSFRYNVYYYGPIAAATYHF
jgi:hypothetical protein